MKTDGKAERSDHEKTTYDAHWGQPSQQESGVQRFLVKPPGRAARFLPANANMEGFLDKELPFGKPVVTVFPQCSEDIAEAKAKRPLILTQE